MTILCPLSSDSSSARFATISSILSMRVQPLLDILDSLAAWRGKQGDLKMYAWLSNETATVSDLPPRAIELPATYLGQLELAWHR